MGFGRVKIWQRSLVAVSDLKMDSLGLTGSESIVDSPACAFFHLEVDGLLSFIFNTQDVVVQIKG